MAGVMEPQMQAELVVARRQMHQSRLLFKQRHAEPQGSEGGGNVTAVPAATDNREGKGHGGSFIPRAGAEQCFSMCLKQV